MTALTWRACFGAIALALCRPIFCCRSALTSQRPQNNKYDKKAGKCTYETLEREGKEKGEEMTEKEKA